MEGALRKSGDGCEVKEEKIIIESSCDIEEDCKDQMVLEVGNRKRDHEDDSLRALSPKEKDLSCRKQDDDQLELAKAKMGKVREENQRLRMHLHQMIKDYQTLQQKFHETIQEETKESTQKMEESKLVSLSLGRNPKKDDKFKTPSKGEVHGEGKEGLELGLDCKFESSQNPRPENSLEEVKEEAGQAWPPQKILKTMRSGDDEVSQQCPMKKARVSVRVRCDTPTMNDGCQWRKYGQKVAKGNPCPRAYYRCTIAPLCPVRKQVQRCSEDMSILITTYEGTHNHPLPLSATTMASTTSAAASMLLSGSSSSESSPYSSATTATELHGLNFSLSNNSKSNQFYLTNSSISPSPLCPTITLDLTSNPSSSSSHFNKISTNLNFGSLESNTSSISWSYGTQPYNKNQIGLLNFGRQTQENLYQSYMQKSILSPTQQSIQLNTIEATTKAITLDPSFQSALATALTSIIGSDGGGGGGGGGAVGNYGGGDKFG